MTASAWALEIARDDLSRTRLHEEAAPEPEPGEAVLRTDRVGLTANNVTYAVLGDAFRYWDFFPAAPGWGRVPLWGFAEVVASRAEGLTRGTRVYGYLPSASHLRVRPGAVTTAGFRDTSEHRAGLPSPYNAYVLTTGDPAHEPDHEDLQVLFRPLYWTSWLLADQLLEGGDEPVVLTSASSKTAYGTAHDLTRAGRSVLGLTSRGNVPFVEGLGCYADVLAYDELSRLERRPTRVVDLAGDADLTRALRAHLADDLVAELVVGVTHQQPGSAGSLDDERTRVFFAPDRIRARTADWGREGLESRFADAWRAFRPTLQGWVDVVESHGPTGLEQVWRSVQAGRTAPREGHVVQL